MARLWTWSAEPIERYALRGVQQEPSPEAGDGRGQRGSGTRDAVAAMHVAYDRGGHVPRSGQRRHQAPALRVARGDAEPAAPGR